MHIGCSTYGKKGACPPSVPSIVECREFFSEYESIVVIRIQRKLENPEQRKKWSRETNVHLLKLEKAAFLAGYYKAFLLFMDECQVCDECSEKLESYYQHLISGNNHKGLPVKSKKGFS